MCFGGSSSVFSEVLVACLGVSAACFRGSPQCVSEFSVARVWGGSPGRDIRFQVWLRLVLHVAVFRIVVDSDPGE